MSYPDQRCNTCGRRHSETAPLFPCSRCKVTFYCCQDHLEQDLPSHRVRCYLVTAAGRELQARQTTVLEALWAFCAVSTPPARFTRDYTARSNDLRRARELVLPAQNHCVYLLASLNTRASLQVASDLAMSCLGLDHRDVERVREGDPALLLLLDKLPECYDFIKWWAQAPARNFGQRFLDIHGADPTEPVAVFDHCSSISTLLALTFIKVELATQIRDVIHALTVVQTRFLPAEADCHIAQFLAPPTLLCETSRDELRNLRKNLMTQACVAFGRLDPRVWWFVLQPQTQDRRFRSDVGPWFCFLAQLWSRHSSFIQQQLGKTSEAHEPDERT